MSSTLRHLVLPLIGLAVLLTGAARAADRDSAAELIARMDELWIERAEPEHMAQLLDLGRQVVEINSQSYDATWRVARAYWFLAHTAGDQQRTRESAAAGMRYAQQAIAIEPNRVEGQFMYALSVASYATTLTPLDAVLEGVATKFENAALEAYRCDRDFDHGGPMIALGRYYFELPWPLRDLRRSRKYLEEAQRLHPESLYTRVYLAETYYALGEEERAEQQLESVLAVAGSTQESPEMVESLHLARQALERWFPERTQLFAVGSGQ